VVFLKYVGYANAITYLMLNTIAVVTSFDSLYIYQFILLFVTPRTL